MSGYRGIFLDSIHPQIVKRLDVDTFGMSRNRHNTAESGQSHLTSNLQTLRYLQERTPWIRAVPFAIPKKVYKTQGQADEEENPEAAPSGSHFLKVEDTPRVPHWRNWVLFGSKAAHAHGSKQDSHENPDRKWSGKSTRTQGYGDDEWTLYRKNSTDWRGQEKAGQFGAPLPGITQLSVSNKGDLGTIRRASIDIKVHTLADLEAIEMMYMVPGMSILVEWGWYHSELSVEPINIEQIQSGQKLGSTKKINNQILEKVFGLNPGELHNIDNPEGFLAEGEMGPKAGIYDGFLGTVTKFNWSNGGDGSYDVRIDIISPGSLSTEVECSSYVMATQDDDGIPMTDIYAVSAVLKSTTAKAVTKMATDKQNADLYRKIGDAGAVYVDTKTGAKVTINAQGDSFSGVEIDIPSDMLDTGDYGVTISPSDEEGGLTYTVVKDKKKEDEEGYTEYYVGEYQDDKAYELEVIKGDKDWWHDLIYWCIPASAKGQEAYISAALLQTWDRPDDIMDIYNDDDEEWALAELNGIIYRGMEEGNYVVKRGTGSTAPGVGRGWDLYYLTEDGSLKSSFKLDQGGTFYWNKQIRFFPQKKSPGRPTMKHPDGSTIYALEDFDESGDWTYSSGMIAGNSLGGRFTGEKNGEWRDKAGNIAVSEGTMASKGNQPVAYRKKEGVSVYQRVWTDGKWVNSLVKNIEGSEANIKKNIKDAVNAGITEVSTGIKNTHKKEVADNVKIQNDRVALIANKDALSWGAGKSKSVVFGGRNGKYYDYASSIFCVTQAAFVPKGIELGYSAFESKGQTLYPVGTTAYSETYVSWRFIEDYIINELFMPRSVVTGNTDSTWGELENSFHSITTLNDREKLNLVALAEVKDDPNTKDVDESANTDVHSSEDITKVIKKAGDGLTEESRNATIFMPQQIINHPHLRSMNPNVCILPGQESTPGIPNDKGKIYKATPARSNQLLDAAVRSPKGRKYDSFVCGKDAYNGFRGYKEDGTRTYSSGILRNIMVNLEIVEEAAEKSDNVRKFVMTILNQVNKACGKPWDFAIINIGPTNQIKVIDKNYTDKYKTYQQQKTMMSNQGVYRFSGVGANNIATNVKIQSKIPSEMATMAYYATMDAGPEKGSALQMFNMYGSGIGDRLKAISKTVILGGKGFDLEAANAQMIESYINCVANSRNEVINDLDKQPFIKEGESMAEDFVKRYIHGDTVEVEAYRPPIPIDVSVDLKGTSGIYMGNAIMIDTVDQGGVLPSRYEGVVGLQATAVDHVISADGWTTSISTLMRPLPDAERKPTVVNLVPSTQSTDQGAMTGTLHSHWYKYLANVPWSAGCISYIVKQAGVPFPYKGAHTKYCMGIKSGDYPNWSCMNPRTTTLKLGDIIVQGRASNKLYYEKSRWGGFSHGDIVVELNGDHVRTIGGNLGNTMKSPKVACTNNIMTKTAVVKSEAKDRVHFVVLRNSSAAERKLIADQAVWEGENFPLGTDEAKESVAQKVYDMFRAGSCWSSDYHSGAPDPWKGSTRSDHKFDD
tara:strand:- start:12224 stop:16771 length:4548 start_codon:yes stop_codon:yes gene_type:complete